jgi:hypothetical protein
MQLRKSPVIFTAALELRHIQMNWARARAPREENHWADEDAHINENQR